MLFKKRKKKRVICESAVLIKYMEESLEQGLASHIEIAYKDVKHNLGITSDCAGFDHVHLKLKNEHFIPKFYVNVQHVKRVDVFEQKFDTLEDFKDKAMLGTAFFMDLEEKIEVLLVEGEVPWCFKFFDDYIIIEDMR